MRTVQKTQSVRAIFTPKSKKNGKVKEAGEKASKKPYWAKFGRNAEHEQSENSRFLQGRKSSRLKSLGRKRPRLDSQRTATADRTRSFGTFALSKKCGSIFRLWGRLGCRKYQKSPVFKGKTGCHNRRQNKNDKRRWAYGVLEKLEY